MKYLKTLLAVALSIPAICFSSAPDIDPNAAWFMQQMLINDLHVFRGDGKGLVEWPISETDDHVSSEVMAWLQGHDASALPISSKDKSMIFRLYWSSTYIPNYSKCYSGDINSDACQKDLEAALREGSAHEDLFKTDYEKSAGPLGLPPYAAPQAKPKEMGQRDPIVAAPVHPLPSPRAYANALQNCEDLGLSSGNTSIAENCRSSMAHALSDLKNLSFNASIRPELWAACYAASGFEAADDYEAWDHCVRFVVKSCPASSIHDDNDYRRCLRAIDNGGWALRE